MYVDTGLPPVGRVEWGTHFCHFFRGAEDLGETLVPYFKSGLQAGEACLWITAPPYSKEAGLAALRVYFADLDERIGAGQLAVLDHGEWYERYGRVSRSDVAGMWVEYKHRAVARGYSGLRLSGNTAFLREDQWRDFYEYEDAVRQVFRSHEILALCSYEADRWNADAVLDMVKAHDFALARRSGTWELIESASVSRTKEALVALNADLERRIEERTRALSEALDHQRLLTAELSHRVKNTIASVQSLVDQTLRRYSSPGDARSVVFGRLAALGRAHEQLSMHDWTGVNLREIAMQTGAAFGNKVRIDLPDAWVNARAALDLALVFHELMTNAAKYGALCSETGSVGVSLEQEARRAEMLTVVWRERGGPHVAKPAGEGFGMRLIRQLATHDLRGDCDFEFAPEGLTCTLRLPTAGSIAHACPHGCTH